MGEFFAHTPETQAMRLPGYLIGFVLAVLLASTTPVGTGAGVHQLDLLHPLFSHLHLVNGRLLTHEQMAEGSEVARPPSRGVGVDAGSATTAASGLGVSPTLPTHPVVSFVTAPVTRVGMDALTPAGLEEPPPDPPPL